MECNKEEAMRAKAIAEAKMLNKDFTTAHKIILKAQKLFPDLESASHMQTVCEVHLAAESKINGEIDWHAILQVPQNADESAIKKQYRKLALLLHPDKNNFGGAEAAFKLIGEAQRTLTDRSKNGLKTTTFRPVLPTFWTMCTSCKMKYQYYAEIKDRTLICQTCKKSFVARDLHSQPAPSAAPWNRTGFPGPKSNVFETKFEEVNLSGAKKNTQAPRFTNQKRAKKSETVKLETMFRKTKQKQVVINSDDDDFVTKKPKTVNVEEGKKEETENAEKDKRDAEKDKKEGTENAETDKKNVETDKKEETDSVSYPDPEFYDFGKDREESKFLANQIWAIYDNIDAMPRFYALIREVYAPKFKLRFNWLEFDPTTKDEAHWTRNDLPTGAGKFKLGKTEHTQEPLMFSHVMTYNRSISAYNTYKLHPRKGEAWAVFKNWDAKWSPDKENRKYGYEVVEVLSDLSNGRCITVARLVKVQGFVSLFTRCSGTFDVESKDLLRFSHKVPSYRVTGREKDGVPLGCVELDPASLPLNFSETLVTDVPNSYIYPESEFHNFEEERSVDKFKEGQIWALYSEVNKNPNYYAIVTKIEKGGVFKVHLTWLEGCPEYQSEGHWFEEELPFGCGSFVTNPEPAVVDSPEAFSHVVSPCITEGSGYRIYPCVGEIWALYKDWSDKWAVLDLEKSGFELVEVLKPNGSSFEVEVLVKVGGYKAVFRGTGEVMEIGFGERLKFSHRIPAFRIGDEKGGKLRGFLELDPAAVPEILMRGG